MLTYRKPASGVLVQCVAAIVYICLFSQFRNEMHLVNDVALLNSTDQTQKSWDMLWTHSTM